jgi:hypothetical protein
VSSTATRHVRTGTWRSCNSEELAGCTYTRTAFESPWTVVAAHVVVEYGLHLRYVCGKYLPLPAPIRPPAGPAPRSYHLDLNDPRPIHTPLSVSNAVCHGNYALGICSTGFPACYMICDLQDSSSSSPFTSAWRFSRWKYRHNCKRIDWSGASKERALNER